MTTIVYDHENGLIALDSRITSAGVIKTDDWDKTLVNDQGLWFFSGATSDFETLSELKHDDEVKVFPDCSAILIKNKKAFIVGVNEDKYCFHTHLTWSDSIGSGLKFALSALDFGKTAKEAVEYAITKDCYTGGKIRVFNLKGKEI